MCPHVRALGFLDYGTIISAILFWGDYEECQPFVKIPISPMGNTERPCVTPKLYQSLLTSCNKLVTTSRYQDVFAWLPTGCWWKVCCMLSTDVFQAEQASCNLFQQVVTSLQMTSCNKPDLNRLVATWWNWQACCKLLTSYNKLVKLTTCNKFCGAFGCVNLMSVDRLVTNITYLLF